MNKPKRSRDTNQLAKHVVDVAIGESKESWTAVSVNEFARTAGRKGAIARADWARWHTDGRS